MLSFKIYIVTLLFVNFATESSDVISHHASLINIYRDPVTLRFWGWVGQINTGPIFQTLSVTSLIPSRYAGLQLATSSSQNIYWISSC